MPQPLPPASPLDPASGRDPLGGEAGARPGRPAQGPRSARRRGGLALEHAAAAARPRTAAVRSSVRAILLARAIPKEAARLEVEVLGYIWEMGMRDPSIQDAGTCLREIEGLRDALARVCALHVSATLVAAQMYDWLAHLTSWRLGREALLAGLDLPLGADTHETLWRISRGVAELPGARALAARWERIGLAGMESGGEAGEGAVRIARALKSFLQDPSPRSFPQDLGKSLPVGPDPGLDKVAVLGDHADEAIDFVGVDSDTVHGWPPLFWV